MSAVFAMSRLHPAPEGLRQAQRTHVKADSGIQQRLSSSAARWRSGPAANTALRIARRPRQPATSGPFSCCPDQIGAPAARGRRDQVSGELASKTRSLFRRASFGQVGSCPVAIEGGTPGDAPQATPARALNHEQAIGARHGEIERQPREAAVDDPTFPRDRIGDAHTKACLVRCLPARSPIEHVKMHHRQAELSPELHGKACHAAAVAANNDDPAHGMPASHRIRLSTLLSSLGRALQRVIFAICRRHRL